MDRQSSSELSAAVLYSKLTGDDGVVRFNGLSEGAAYSLSARGVLRSEYWQSRRAESRLFTVSATPGEIVDLRVPPVLASELKALAPLHQAPATIQALRASKWSKGQPVNLVSSKSSLSVLVCGGANGGFRQAELVQQQYGDQGVLVVGIQSFGQPKLTSGQASSSEYGFPIAIDDEESRIHARYGMTGDGSALLYDKDGRFLVRIPYSNNLLWIVRNHFLYQG